MSAKTEYYAKVASDASRDLTGSVQKGSLRRSADCIGTAFLTS